jgi:hypothetical protein
MESMSEPEVTSEQEPIVDAVESTTNDSLPIYDGIPTNGQIQPVVYNYKVVVGDAKHFVAVIAPSGTAAHEGLKQQFPSGSFYFLHKSDIIMQVNGQNVI